MNVKYEAISNDVKSCIRVCILSYVCNCPPTNECPETTARKGMTADKEEEQPNGNPLGGQTKFITCSFYGIQQNTRIQKYSSYSGFRHH